MMNSLSTRYRRGCSQLTTAVLAMARVFLGIDFEEAEEPAE